MSTSLRASASALAASTLLAAGCAYQPTTYTPAYETRTEPLVQSNRYPSGQTYEKRLAWKGPESVGNCVASERGTMGAAPLASSTAAAQALGMDSETTAAFTGPSRTGYLVACSYTNALSNPSAAPTARRGAAAGSAAPVFNNVQVMNTGDYYVADSFTQCKGTVVMVQPSSQQPGQAVPDMIYGPRALPEFGGYQVPQGWAVVKGPITYNGSKISSSTLCLHARTVSGPVVR